MGRDTNQRAGEKIPAGDENEICWWWGSFFTKGKKRSPAGRDTNRGTGRETVGRDTNQRAGEKIPAGDKSFVPAGVGILFSIEGERSPADSHARG
jgi:hypothetical protein